MASIRFNMLALTPLALGVLVLSIAPSALASETTTYTYDVHGRLVEVNITDTNTGNNNDGVKVVYEYDDAHNRTKKTVTGAP